MTDGILTFGSSFVRCLPNICGMKRRISEVTGDISTPRTAKTPRRNPPLTERGERPETETMAPPFRFMDLPAELRELIYYHAFTPIKPIDTAAIPKTPDRVFIQPIAQLSKQTRHEALHVLFTSRPVEISLHSDENLRRALLWAQKWQTHACALPQLIFSGRIAKHEFQFFTITLDISDEAPFFRASAKKAASEKSDIFIDRLKQDMLAWLATALSGVDKGREGKLSGSALSELIGRVAGSADCRIAGRTAGSEAFMSGRWAMTSCAGGRKLP